MWFLILYIFLFTVKPTSVNVTSKPKHFASEIEYSINCEVKGSIPETEIRWTQNNRPFKRGKVSWQTQNRKKQIFCVNCLFHFPSSMNVISLDCEFLSFPSNSANISVESSLLLKLINWKGHRIHIRHRAKKKSRKII